MLLPLLPREQHPRAGLGYLGALGALGALAGAVGLRLLVDPVLGPRLALFTLYPAVAIAVWCAGWRVAAAVAMSGYVLMDVLFIEPRGQISAPLNAGNMLALMMLAATLAIIIASGEAMRRSRARERAGRRLYQTTLNSIGDAVITTDANGRITFMNPVACRLTGWPAGLAEGLPLADVFRSVDEQTHEVIDRPVDQVRHAERAVRMANRTVLIGRDAAERPIEDSAAPIRDADGRLSGAVVVFRDVTERRRAELEMRASAERLRLSERRLRIALSASRMYAWTWDLRTSILDRQGDADVILGLPPSSPLSLSEQWTPPDDLAAARAAIDRAIAEHGDYAVDLRFSRPDTGALVWVHTRGSVECDEAGEPVRVVGSTMDITARKLAEQDVARRASEHAALFDFTDRLQRAGTAAEMHDAALDTIAGALGCDRASVLLFDDNGVMRFAAWRRLSDEYRQAVEGHTPWPPGSMDAAPMAIADLDAGDIAEPLKRVMRDEGIAALAFIPLVGDARLIGKFMLYYDRPHEFEREELELAVTIARQLAFALERERVEVERQRAELALRESEQRFRLMADAAPVMIWMSDTGMRCTWLNATWLSFVGRRLEEESGFGWLEHMHPDDVASAVERYTAAFRARLPMTMEYRLRRRDGEYRWILNHGVPLYRGEQFVGYIGSCVDLSDRVRAEAALRDADRRKDEFLATLAHELRNPLAPIRNSLEIIRYTDGRGPAFRQARDTMQRQLDHLVRLVDDLLDVSRITSGRIELRRETVDLVRVLRQAVESCRPLADAMRHKLTMTVPEDTLVVSADPVRLAQIFSNLLNNACKFTEPGGRIAVTAWRDGGEALVAVTDTGIGIEPECQRVIFEMFGQVDKSLERSRSGLGIGLSLATRLAELHGGGIEARSDGPGRGSEFTVHLPLSGDVPADLDDHPGRGAPSLLLQQR
jgi:PAS domain S-box-containing protein